MKKQTYKNSLLELFNLLDCAEYKKDVILKKQNISSSMFHKNIQKLKMADFNVNKKNGRYSIKRFKNILDLDHREKSVIAYMLNLASEFLPHYKYNYFENFIVKFLMFSKENDFKEVFKKYEFIKKYSLIEEYEEKIASIEYYIAQKKKIKIVLRTGNTLLIRPLSFSWKEDKAILRCVNYETNTEEKINIDLIAKIIQIKENDYIIKNEEIIFELYGTLAKRYLLKENERVIKSKKDSIVIGSCVENKEKLFKRLLRYDTLCKILFPKSEVEAFNKLIDKAIINLD